MEDGINVKEVTILKKQNIMPIMIRTLLANLKDIINGNTTMVEGKFSQNAKIG